MIALSVIIPTQNRSTLLAKTLSSITRQGFPVGQFEVIVIDNGSTDDTKAVCEGFSGTLPHFRYVYDPRPGLHVGRHRGLREAEGKVLVYADDDINPYETWLQALADSFSDPAVGMAGGNDLPEFESAPPPWFDQLWIQVPEGKYITQFSLIDFGNQPREISPYYIFGCNFAIRKQLLLEVGGFHPDGVPKKLLRLRGDGESYVAASVLAKKCKVVFNPLASVYHWVPASRMTLQYIYDRAYAQGVSDSFTRIRAEHLTADLQPRPPAGRLVKTLKNKLKDTFKGPGGTAAGEVQNAIARGYAAGFRFHQDEVAQDPELLSWVLKPNFLD